MQNLSGQRGFCLVVGAFLLCTDYSKSYIEAQATKLMVFMQDFCEAACRSILLSNADWERRAAN